MPTVTQPQQENVSIDVASLRRKVAWRILPLVFLLYIVAYLDRANVGFAKLRMASDLHFSDAVYGLGIGIFFIGYLLLEIPGALLVERWSARKWFARILITWGFISALTAFVTTPMQFYVARFFLGVAEAGFFPGIIVYFTHWFTSQDRTRALSGLVMAVPFSLAMGAPVSALAAGRQLVGIRGMAVAVHPGRGSGRDPGIRDARHYDGSTAPGEVVVPGRARLPRGRAGG